MSTVGEKIWLQLANAAYKSHDPYDPHLVYNIYTFPPVMFTFGDASFPAFSKFVDHKIDGMYMSECYDSKLYMDKRNRHKLFALEALCMTEEPSTIYRILERLFIIRPGSKDINLDLFGADTLSISYFDTEIQEVFFEKICMSWLRVSKAVRVIAERYREHLQRKRNHMVSHVLVPFIVRNHVN
jgi:hypothetical protein